MVQAIEIQQAITRARELVSGFDQPPGCVDIVALAHELGISAVEPADITADGYLGRRPDGTLVIRYRSRNGTQRNRFTIAHEVAHLLLAQAQGKTISHLDKGYSRDPFEETTVNRIAAELLMPAPPLLDELEQCERRGRLPGWRTINALCHAYQVSTTAMAFRILELPSVNAISFRINIEGRGPTYPFDRSDNSGIRLVNGVEFEMERLWREARKGTRHSVPVRKRGEVMEILCEGIVKSINNRLESARHYWVIGWTTTVVHSTDNEFTPSNES